MPRRASAKKAKRPRLKALVLPNLPEAELREFVLALCDNRIFSSAHMGPHQLQHLTLIFMPLCLGALRGYTKASLKEIGVFYEYYSDAAPRSMNGMPMFASVRMLNTHDWARARTAYETEMARRKEIRV